MKLCEGKKRQSRERSLEERISILREYWPKINPGKNVIEAERKEIISGAEGFFAFIRRSFFRRSYNEALEEVLEAVNNRYDGKFHNYRAGELGPYYLRQCDHVASVWNKIETRQKEGDIVVVPAQRGSLYKGYPVVDVRQILLSRNNSEFGLGALAVGVTLLTHPKSIDDGDIDIDCPGDEYLSPSNPYYKNKLFARSPYYSFRDGKVSFGMRAFNLPIETFGSATGFSVIS